MHIKLICCDVFLRPVSAFIATSPHTIDVEYIPMLAHIKPDSLRADLQTRINTAATIRNYDLLLLLYGLCGNATVGLSSPVKMVMPRVHDCCAVFMGSQVKFLKEFGNNLSMRWCTSGYYERGQNENTPSQFRTTPEYIALVEQYGEENAEYIWETMHPEIETPEAAYIRLPGFEMPGHEAGFKSQVEAQNKTLKILEGDTTYLEAMINGPWNDNRFLTINPGDKVVALYDMERVITTKPVRM